MLAVPNVQNYTLNSSLKEGNPGKLNQANGALKSSFITKMSSKEIEDVVEEIKLVVVGGSASKQRTEESVEKYLARKENRKLLLTYACEILEVSKKSSFEQKIPENFMEKHGLTSSARTKMVDWMIEIFAAYQSADETFFLAVNILDKFLSKVKYSVQDDDIHLLGMCCIFLANKFEDVFPFSLPLLANNIGHGKFTEKTIKKKEVEILKLLKMDFFNVSSEDFFLTIFKDFTSNNKQLIESTNLSEVLVYFKKLGCFFAKLMEHYDEFSSISSFEKSSICMSVTTYFMKARGKIPLTKEQSDTLSSWSTFVIKENNVDTNMLCKYVNLLIKKLDSILHSGNEWRIIKFSKLEF